MPGSVFLIVVDNPTHRVLFNRHLGGTPHHLVFAADGEEAFDRFLEVKPDLVIAHVNAPRLDGTILCQLIRQQPRGDTVPFVLLSEEFVKPGVGDARIQVVGADGFLPFPFDRALLIERTMALVSFGRPELKRAVPVGAATPEAKVEAVAHDAETVMPEDESGQASEADLRAFVEGLSKKPDEPAKVEPSPSLPEPDTVVSYLNPYGAESVHSYRPVIESVGPKGEADLGPHQLEPETHLDTGHAPLLPFDDSDAARARLAKGSGDNPLEEPRIQEHTGSRVIVDPLAEQVISSKVARPEGSQRLIQEVPRDVTPSSEKRAGALEDEAGARRGLDESQLGKRLAKRVRTMFRLLDEVDYYQLLGIDPDASEAVLQRAYFELSLEFHPDRFFVLRSGDLKEKIYAIYRRINEAYTVLSDDRRRSVYDEARVEKRQKRAGAELREVLGAIAAADTGVGTERQMQALEVALAVPKAKELFELARAALADGEVHRARLLLHMALGYERENAKLRDALAQVAELTRPAV